MAAGGQSGRSAPLWRLLYETAVLEGDLDKLPQRINDAQAAITKRLQSLDLTASDTERLALLDAHHVLCDLCKMAGLDIPRSKPDCTV